MGQVKRHGSAPSPAVLGDCLCLGPEERGVAQPGMAGRRHETQGVYATEDQERGNTGGSHDPGCARSLLGVWKERRLDTNRVFLYKGKPWKNSRTAFAAACRRAGITGLRLHDLRHTASTNLRRAGVDTMTAMKIVGHKSEQLH